MGKEMIVLLCVLGADDPEPPAKGLTELKGTWTVTRIIFLGRETKSPEGSEWIFDGHKLTRTFAPKKDKGKEGAAFTYKVKVDTSKTPHRLTTTPDTGGKDGKWIFKIEKGDLHLAMSKSGDFPADFGKENVGGMVLTRAAKK